MTWIALAASSDSLIEFVEFVEEVGGDKLFCGCFFGGNRTLPGEAMPESKLSMLSEVDTPLVAATLSEVAGLKMPLKPSVPARLVGTS